MSHDARYGSRPGGGPHERRNRRHHRFGGGRGGPRRDSRPSTGGFWGFIKKLFGMGGGSSASAPSQQRHSNGRTSAPRVPRNRTAPPMEVLTPRLYVGNLSYDASESDVFDHLSKIAAVKNVEVVREGGGNSKGFAFAEMQTLEGAQEVAKKLHDTDFMGRLADRQWSEIHWGAVRRWGASGSSSAGRAFRKGLGVRLRSRASEP